jgi:hypothetical protein
VKTRTRVKLRISFEVAQTGDEEERKTYQLSLRSRQLHVDPARRIDPPNRRLEPVDLHVRQVASALGILIVGGHAVLRWRAVALLIGEL